MSRRRSATRSEPAAEPRAAIGLFDHVLFFALLAVYCARPLISETLQQGSFSFLDAAVQRSGPTPLATIGLDAITLVVSVLALARRAKFRSFAVSLGIALLAVAVAVSTIAAGDVRAAMNSGADMLILIVGGVALFGLARRRWMVNLLLAGVIAAAGVNALKCVTQWAYEFQWTAEAWQQQKQQLIAQGVDVDTPLIANFERRIGSQNASGYLSHPNVAAACMNVGILLAIGLLPAFERRRGIPPSGWLMFALLVLVVSIGAFALKLTASNGGIVSAIVGGGIIAIAAVFRETLAAHRKWFAGLLLGSYAAIVVGGAAFGLLRGTLPGASLAFRWQYWTAAAGVIADHPLTGVGRENFGTAYLRHKQIDSTEEIHNAHDLWISLLAELGPLGLLGGALLIGGVFLQMTRGLAAKGPDKPIPQEQTGTGVVPALIGFGLVQGWFSGALLQPVLTYLWIVELVLVFAVAFAAALRCIEIAQSRADGPALLSAACIAAFAAALLHNLIGFALWTPAGLALFVIVAVCGARFGAGFDEATPEGKRTNRVNWPVLIAGAAAIAAYCLFVVAPSARSQHAIEAMRDALGGPRTDVARAVAAGERAIAADRWDAGAALLVARAFVGMVASPDAPDALRSQMIDRAESAAQTARERNPANSAPLRLLAKVEEQRALAAERQGDAAAQLEAAKRCAAYWNDAIDRYPTQVRNRIAAAEACTRLWRLTHDNAAAAKTHEHLRQALAIDATRSADNADKLRPNELDKIHALESELSSD